MEQALVIAGIALIVLTALATVLYGSVFFAFWPPRLRRYKPDYVITVPSGRIHEIHIDRMFDRLPDEYQEFRNRLEAWVRSARGKRVLEGYLCELDEEDDG